MPEPAPVSPGRRRRTLRPVGYAVVWLVFSVPAALWLFTHTSQTTTLASHDASLTPTFDGKATARMGPFLPDLRADSGGPIGVNIDLGKTEASSTEQLVARYGFIASEPEAQVAKARSVIVRIAWLSALRGGLLGLIPLAVWMLIGAERRSQLRGRLLGRRAAIPVLAGSAVALGAVTLAVLEPWAGDEPTLDADREWVSLSRFIPELQMPPELGALQIRADLTSDSTKTLALSAIDTYARSKEFYSAATREAAALQVRQPRRGETVAVLVSDRHDNIGMDAVVAAAARNAGASAVIDAGDDTSTGSSWEAFSLDSLDRSTRELPQRFAIAGNHDNGKFVSDYLADKGWTHLDGTVIEGPGGSRITGVDDPRSSGLGTWRNESGLSFDEQTDKIAESVCAADRAGDRVNTLVVHDANSGAKALAEGCVDLVVSGHLHVQEGPTRVAGSNGSVGWAYTNGTTGGAAYAIAVGSKLRREAQFTFITYANARPVGIQPVRLRTDGKFLLDDYVALSYSAAPTD